MEEIILPITIKKNIHKDKTLITIKKYIVILLINYGGNLLLVSLLI